MLCTRCNGQVASEDKFCPFCGTLMVQEQVSSMEEFADDYEELINIDALIEEAQKQSEESNSYDEILASLEKITGASNVKEEQVLINPILADIPMMITPTELEEPEPTPLPILEQPQEAVVAKEVEEPVLEQDMPISAVEAEEQKSVAIQSEEKKSRKPIVSIVMLILLTLSMALNIILLSNVAGKSMSADKSKISENKIKILSNKYYLWVPDNWISTTSPDGVSTIFDESEAWATSFHFAENINYEMVTENTKAITDTFGQNKYLFTSDYTKKVEDTNFIIFKGKYQEYVIYVMVASFDDNTIALADLKFKGEVSEDIVNSVMSALTTASTKDVSDVWKDNFKFDNMSEMITAAIQDEEV